MVGGVGTARRSKTMSSLPCLIGLAYRSSPRDWTKRDGSMMPAGRPASLGITFPIPCGRTSWFPFSKPPVIAPEPY